MPDGLGPVLRGGLEKSDVERAIRILEVLTDRVESVLRWVKAPDSTPADRGNRLVVRFCGVVYRNRDPICGREYRGRGGSGRYLDVGGRANHRVRASERVVRNLGCFLQSVDARLRVLRGAVVAWCTDHTLTCTNTAILHRVLTKTLLDLDGQACICQDFRDVPWTEDVTTAAAAAHHCNEVTDATTVPTCCFGTWSRPAEVSETVVFACAGGICKLDPRMRATLEGIESPWHRSRPKPRRRSVRTRGHCISVRHPFLVDRKVANVLCRAGQTTSDLARLLPSHRPAMRYAGLQCFHHRVLTLSVDGRRARDVLAVSFRVHLETEVFVTLMWRVLREFVRRIRGPLRVGPNVHHPPLEDLRKVVDVSWPVLTVATELLATQYAGLPRFHHRVLTLSVDVRRYAKTTLILSTVFAKDSHHGL
jgi:hypothetical protein